MERRAIEGRGKREMGARRGRKGLSGNLQSERRLWQRRRANAAGDACGGGEIIEPAGDVAMPVDRAGERRIHRREIGKREMPIPSQRTTDQPARRGER